MKTTKNALILSLMLAGAVCAVSGDNNTRAPSRPHAMAATASKDAGEKELKGEDAAKKEAPAEAAQRASVLAEKFGVTVPVITDMRDKNNLGWGEIDNALQIAQHIVKTATTPITIDDALKQVLAARSEGMGWGQIADNYGAKLGHLRHEGVDARKKDSPGRGDRPDNPDKPDKPPKPDKPNKPDNRGLGN